MSMRLTVNLFLSTVCEKRNDVAACVINIYRVIRKSNFIFDGLQKITCHERAKIQKNMSRTCYELRGSEFDE